MQDDDHSASKSPKKMRRPVERRRLATSRVPNSLGISNYGVYFWTINTFSSLKSDRGSANPCESRSRIGCSLNILYWIECPSTRSAHTVRKPQGRKVNDRWKADSARHPRPHGPVRWEFIYAVWESSFREASRSNMHWLCYAESKSSDR